MQGLYWDFWAGASFCTAGNYKFQLFSSITLCSRNVRKRGGTFRKTYSEEGDSRSIFRSGIWEESKNPKSCLTAKRRAGQLAFAQTIPACRLTTPLRLLRSSDRFLQRRMSLLLPPSESISKSSSPLPALFKLEMLLPKLADKRSFGAA